MNLGKSEVKSMYSPLTIFSLILAGMGGKAGCGSDGVGSDVVIPDEQGGLGCIEDLGRFALAEKQQRGDRLL